MQTMNKVTVSGRMITRNERGNNMQITVVSSNRVDVYIRFLIDPSMQDAVKDIPIRAHVNVEGYIRSYRFKNQRTGKVEFYTALVASSIEQQKTLAEDAFGVPGRFYRHPECQALIAGEVGNVIDGEEWIRYLIRVPNQSRPEQMEAIQLSMRRIDRQPDIAKGDEIYAVCSISTPEKVLNGKKTTFLNFVVNDIAVQKKE